MFQETGARLPYALSNVPLPAEFKEKLWKRLKSDAPPTGVVPPAEVVPPAADVPPAARRHPRIWLPLSLAALLALFAIGLWRTRAQISERDTQIAALEQQLTQQKQEIAWLRDPSVQLALLSGVNPAPDAKGKMVWNPTVSRGIFYASSLPDLSEGKDYQLWVIGNAGPVSAGVFSPNQQGNAVITISRIEGTAQGALQFAVTIEPRGGVPQPTGSMILAGKPL